MAKPVLEAVQAVMAVTSPVASVMVPSEGLNVVVGSVLRISILALVRSAATNQSPGERATFTLASL